MRTSEFMFEICGTCVVDVVVLLKTVDWLSRLTDASGGVGNSVGLVNVESNGLISAVGVIFSVGAALELFAEDCDEFGESASSIVSSIIWSEDVGRGELLIAFEGDFWFVGIKFVGRTSTESRGLRRVGVLFTSFF